MIAQKPPIDRDHLEELIGGTNTLETEHNQLEVILGYERKPGTRPGIFRRISRLQNKNLDIDQSEEIQKDTSENL